MDDVVKVDGKEYEVEFFAGWQVGPRVEDLVDPEGFVEFVRRHGAGYYSVEEYGDEPGFPAVWKKIYNCSGPSWAHTVNEVPRLIDVWIYEGKEVKK